jgi:hypothetical protein
VRYPAMNFTWLIALLFLSQQVNMPDSLLITNHGQLVSTVNRTDFSMNLPGIPMMNTEKIQKLMDEINKRVSKKPKNAMIDKNGNSFGLCELVALFQFLFRYMRVSYKFISLQHGFKRKTKKFRSFSS